MTLSTERALQLSHTLDTILVDDYDWIVVVQPLYDDNGEPVPGDPRDGVASVLSSSTDSQLIRATLLAAAQGVANPLAEQVYDVSAYNTEEKD